MQGVVSPLNEKAHAQVFELWNELENRFDIKSPKMPRIPHFSYQIAPKFDMDQLSIAVQKCVAQLNPFSVDVSGIGIFTTAEPVIYLSMARTPKLSHAHTVICEAISMCSDSLSELYTAKRWMPHITLAHGALNSEKLSAVVGWLSEQDLPTKIQVNELAVIDGNQSTPELIHQTPLSK